MHTNGSETTSVLGTLYSSVAAIDATAIVVPQMHKCSHYVQVGVADEATMRVFAYLWSLERELEEFIKNARGRHMRHAFRYMMSFTEAQRKAIEAKVSDSIKQLERDVSNRTRTIAVCEQLVRLELARQFPEADLDDVKQFHVDEAWNVGYMDHSNVGDELAEALRSSGFMEDDIPEDLFGERPPMDGRRSASFVVGVGPDGKQTILSEELGDIPPEIADFIRDGILSGKGGPFVFDPSMMRVQD